MFVRLQIAVPASTLPGTAVRFTHNGRTFDAQVPANLPHGAPFLVDVPSDAPPTGLPVGNTQPPAAASSRSGPVAAPAWENGQALRHAECPICFEPLHEAPVAVFTHDNKRVSPHYFNLAAAREWLRAGNGQCPLTRQRVTAVVEVPDIRKEPLEWWKVVDLNGDGRLSRLEAINALKAQLPIDNEQLDAAAEDPHHEMWTTLDTNRSGFLERGELAALVEYCERHLGGRSSRNSRGPPPDMRTDREGWYQYWDEDRSGVLHREEVARALLKTLGLTSDQVRVREMRETLGAVWGIFDTDGSGSIDKAEFLRADGLADTILATLEAGARAV